MLLFCMFLGVSVYWIVWLFWMSFLKFCIILICVCIFFFEVCIGLILVDLGEFELCCCLEDVLGVLRLLLL